MDSPAALSWSQPTRLPWLTGHHDSLPERTKSDSRTHPLKHIDKHRLHVRNRSVDGNISSSSAHGTPGPESTASNDANESVHKPSAQTHETTSPTRVSPLHQGGSVTHAAPPSIEDGPQRIPLAQIARGLRTKTSSTSIRPEDPRTTRTTDARSDSDMVNDDVLKSISGLERNMQESVHLANDAARRNDDEEARYIVHHAEQTLDDSARVAEDQSRSSSGSTGADNGVTAWAQQFPSTPHSSSEDEEESTYSVSTSNPDLADRQRPIFSKAAQQADVVHADPPSPSQAILADTSQHQDFAYGSSGLGLPGALRNPASLQKRKTQARFNVSTGTDRNNDKNTQKTADDVGHIGRSLTLKAPQESSEDLAAGPFGQPRGQNWGRDKYDEKDYVSSKALKGKSHLTLREDQVFSIHHHKRQPIARNWETPRKRFVACVACINTALIGMIVGIYAGEVPAIQYAMTDLDHRVILGNVVLYIGMAITTFLCWPLPLLHGRRPYTLVALAITLPLQFPQAFMVGTKRIGDNDRYIVGLLVSRGISGLALGFAHINSGSILLDLFGASLQATHPHGELVVVDDVRRHGGGMGLWLGFWTFCFIGSVGLGFMIGADIVIGLNVAWGFYIIVILIAVVLLLDVMAPETRRSAHRRTMAEVELANMNIARRVARGEIKMHVYGDGPRWWWEEVFAAIYLSLKMIDQPGFGLMALYLGWVYGEIVLVIVLLGNLLSVRYEWPPVFVGLGVFATTVGALLAVPNTKANFFSNSRTHPFRTDSMTFQPRVTWTSHMVRRAAFMILLPLAGIAYTLASAGESIQYMVPIIFAGLIGYISNLAIAECHGLIMEAFDTSDLQPGVNSRHRLQSLQPELKSRRTTYSSFPRVSAGIFTAQTLGFLLAALATGVGGIMTRQVGAQKATGITAGILFGLTLLLTVSLWRFKTVQVIPNHLFGENFGSGAKRDSVASMRSDRSWRAVIIGHPSGKFRRMNLLELGGLSRWTEIRRLNRLLTKTTTQPLNPGWR